MPPGTLSRPDSVGGVVAYIFRDLHKRTTFAGGGLWQNCFPVVARQHHENDLNCGRFFDISGRPGDHPPFLETHRSAYTFKECDNINSLHKKNIYQKSGGPWPPCPPGYATALRGTWGKMTSGAS